MSFKKIFWISVLVLICVLGVLGVLCNLQNFTLADSDVLQGIYALIAFFILFYFFIVLMLRIIWGKICDLTDRYSLRLALRMHAYASVRQMKIERMLEGLWFFYLFLLLAGFAPLAIVLRMEDMIPAYLIVINTAPVLFVFYANFLLESRRCAGDYTPWVSRLFHISADRTDYLTHTKRDHLISRKLYFVMKRILSVRKIYCLTSAAFFMEIFSFTWREIDLTIPVIILICLLALFIGRWIFMAQLCEI